MIETERIRCPRCDTWEVTGRQYLDSIRHDNLGAPNAIKAFQTFVERYPLITAPRERVLLIDRLIHEFHYALSHMPDGSLGRSRVPHATTANNLIVGTHAEVVAFLENLTYGEASSPELRTTERLWRTTAEAMNRRRTARR